MINSDRLKRLLIDTIYRKLKGESEIHCIGVLCSECPYGNKNCIIKCSNNCCDLNNEEIIKVSCYYLSIRELVKE